MNNIGDHQKINTTCPHCKEPMGHAVLQYGENTPKADLVLAICTACAQLAALKGDQLCMPTVGELMNVQQKRPDVWQMVESGQRVISSMIELVRRMLECLQRDASLMQASASKLATIQRGITRGLETPLDDQSFTACWTEAKRKFAESRKEESDGPSTP